jgi:MFS family permease
MLAALRREYRSLPRAFWLIWTGTLVNRLGAFVMPFLTLYLTGHRHISESAAGLIVSLYGVGCVGASLAGGVLSDRIGRRTTMALSLLGGATILFLLGQLQAPAAIGAAACAYGFLGEMYRPAVSAMVADLVAPEDRARAYAHQHWAVNLGFALAPSLGGLLASASYTVLFAADAATTAVFGLLVLLALPETRPTAHEHHDRGGLRAVLSDRVFMMLVVLAFGLGAVVVQSNVALPLDMRRKGLGESWFGALIALNGVLIVLFQHFAIARVRPLRRSRVLTAGALLFGLGFGLHAVARAPFGYAVAIALWTFGEIVSTPVMASVIADLAPPSLRGRYQGVYSTGWSLAAAFGPVTGTAVFDRLGPTALWAGCAAVCVLGALGQRFAGPHYERRRVAALAG